MTNDTWGLNFTSPIDAKQFRECCVSYLYHLNFDIEELFLNKFIQITIFFTLSKLTEIWSVCDLLLLTLALLS